MLLDLNTLYFGSVSKPYILTQRKSEPDIAGTNMGKAVRRLFKLLSSRQPQTNPIQAAEQRGGRGIWENAQFMAVLPGPFLKDTETIVKIVIFNISLLSLLSS